MHDLSPTRLTAKDRLDIRTENHTQLDGAVIASDSGNLKLDTGTLGFSDIAGKDREHGYYLNVGGSYGATTQDKSQEGRGKAGENNWSVSGHDYQKDREQIVRATVGAGEVLVRDALPGTDATAGLNRDVAKAYEITRDDESRTDVYASSSSLKAVAEPIETAKAWTQQLLNYSQTAQQNYELASRGVNAAVNRLERSLGRDLPEGVLPVTDVAMAEATIEALILGGMTPKQALIKMSEPEFQKAILGQLSDLLGVDVGKVKDIQKKVESGDDPTGVALILEVTSVVEKAPSESVQLAVKLLNAFADMQAYLVRFPDEQEALSVVLALAQGPKGLLQIVVQNAAAATSWGQDLAAAQANAGKMLAEYIEGTELAPDDEHDAHQIGGGELMLEVLTGSVLGGKRGVDRTPVSVEGKQGPKGLAKDYVDILSPEAKQHILYGDMPGSGGHMWPGQEGKTGFPESWSGDKIVDAVGDITTSPSTEWYAQTGTGGAYTAKGDAAKWVAYETRDGVRMRVVYQPATGKVVTTFPDDAPIPPCKPIK